MIQLGRLRTNSEDETRAVASRLAAALAPGDVIALVGELGAGKTRFAQGVARGLGVPEDVPITSPTFTLLAIHDQGRLLLHHFDFYRLSKPVDLENLGAEEYLWGEGVCVVEWAERLPGVLPEDALWITISFTGETRVLDFASDHERWRQVLAPLVEQD